MAEGADRGGASARARIVEPMAPSKEQRDHERISVAQSIIAAAANRGGLSLTFPEIARAAGLPESDVRESFASAEEVLIAAASEMLKDRTELFERLARLDPVPPPDVALEKLLLELPESASDAAALLHVWGEGTVNPAIRPATRVSMERIYYAIGDYLRAWFAQDGTDERDAAGVAWACAPVVLSLVQGYAVQTAIRGPLNPRQYVAGVRVLFDSPRSGGE